FSHYFSALLLPGYRTRRPLNLPGDTSVPLCQHPKKERKSMYHYPVPKIFYVQLSVGSNEFIGDGRTRQAARHSAAMKALQALRNEPIPERPPQSPEEKEESEEGSDASKSEISLVYEIALKRNLSVNFERISNTHSPIGLSSSSSALCKQIHFHPQPARCMHTVWPEPKCELPTSPREKFPQGLSVHKKPFFPLSIPSIVLLCSHASSSEYLRSAGETDCRSSAAIPGQVLKESGPPHMKSFLTRVSVGEFSAEGEGNSKKLSKKRAALSILQDLKKLPFIPIVEKPKTHYKKRTKTILKTGPDYGQGMNPISRLAQIQQAKKEKEPEYLLLSERGMPRRREFIMQVKVNGEVATGTGPNKKVAKRNAAEAMLLQLGYKASTGPQSPTELGYKASTGPQSPTELGYKASTGPQSPTELGYKASTGPQSPTEADVHSRSKALNGTLIKYLALMDNKGWNGQKASFTEATSNISSLALASLQRSPGPPDRVWVGPSEKTEPSTTNTLSFSCTHIVSCSWVRHKVKKDAVYSQALFPISADTLIVLRTAKPHETVIYAQPWNATQKGLLHLSPDVYQEMEASRKQGGGVSPGINNSGNSGNSYMTSKDMPPYFSSSSPSPTATMAREMLLNGQTPANAELHLKGKNCGVNVQPAQQLDYLARIQGFQVQYSDAQSGKDFVTYLTLSPVQMTFHGTGSTLQASHDQEHWGMTGCCTAFSSPRSVNIPGGALSVREIQLILSDPRCHLLAAICPPHVSDATLAEPRLQTQVFLNIAEVTVAVPLWRQGDTRGSGATELC
ncbi:Double-stranded RNA-binding protein Staufen like 2, partial [Dissostichus eleginoides]